MTYRSISIQKERPQWLYSICCIVSNMAEYQTMKQSFEHCGFRDDCEYLVADNTQGNEFDAYLAITRFIQEAVGKYVMLVHQDVRCIDKKKMLTRCLDDLSVNDPFWAVCGNAGGRGYHQLVYYLNNAGKIVTHTNLPARVDTLDENFLVINKASSATVSPDLKGFHLYGTDICLVADFMGYHCYVIPFMVKHLSLGNLKDLEKFTGRFIRKYGMKIRSRYLETTCTKFYLSNSPLKNRILNSPLIFPLVKFIQRLKWIGKKISGSDPHKKKVVMEKD